MKCFRITLVLLVGVLAGILYGNVQDDDRRAIRYGAEAKYIYRVVDDEGLPVVGANAHVWFSSYGRKWDNADWTIKTDANGFFTAAHRLNERFSVNVYKEGYYDSSDDIFYLGMMTLPVRDGKWQPYGEERTIVLKKIRKPAALLFKDGRARFKVPLYDTWIGFDFEDYDFLPPHGKGRTSDVLFRFHLSRPTHDEYHMSMEVSFTNNPFAGAYVLKKDASLLESVYRADTNAVYRQILTYTYDRLPGKGTVIDELGEDRYLVFRTRTRIDRDGRLVSAHYGKLYGRWFFVGPKGMGAAQAFFNPVANDTNLEDTVSVRHVKMRQKMRCLSRK